MYQRNITRDIFSRSNEADLEEIGTRIRCRVLLLGAPVQPVVTRAWATLSTESPIGSYSLGLIQAGNARWAV